MAEFDDRLIGIDEDDDEDVRTGELDLQGADAFSAEGPSVVELAFGQRSWRFGHVIVDEAQDLTPMQWRMIVRRARGGSMTIVGDLAQRANGAPTSWRDLLPDSLTTFDERQLTINYRSPEEINALAAGVLRELAPRLTPPTSIRSVGETPTMRPVADLDRSLIDVVAEEYRQLETGRMAVIGIDLDATLIGKRVARDVAVLDPWKAKGLEFDVVVVVEPAAFLDLDHGLSLLYVALTRSTRRLTIVHHRALPDVLGRPA